MANTAQNTICERDSNAELVRIVSMLFIVMHHFIIHAFYREVLPTDIGSFRLDSQIALLAHGFIYVGVDCFILISGFYGIKTRPRSFFRLYLVCATYTLVALIARYLANMEGITLSVILRNTFFAFSYSPHWFVQCYLALFLLAPLLNIALDKLGKKQYLYVLLLLTVLNLYFGYWRGIRNINENGYNVMNMIFIYVIGGYLRRYVKRQTIDANRWYFLGAYILCGVAWCLFEWLCLKSIYRHPLFSYNNPFTIAGALFLFLFLMSFHFKSKVVNFVASSVFAVYLLQEQVFSYKVLYPYAHKYSPALQLPLLLACTVVFFCAAIATDKIRILLTRPVWIVYDKCSKLIQKKIKY